MIEQNRLDTGPATAELEMFKTNIDLRAYAASLGYQLDSKHSWHGSAVMRNEAGDKIIISRQADGHYVYWSVRDENDSGTIIDFVAHRQLKPNLGEVRRELRKWTGLPETTQYEAMPPLCKTKDRRQIEARYSRMAIADDHPYLQQERCIPSFVLQYWRFEDTVRMDRRGNAIFPHHDADGLCGYEIKNKGFTSFSPGGTKGLWRSKTVRRDRRLVICESAIDALSHAILFEDPDARYTSIAGKPTPAQLNLIRVEIERMAPQSEIVAAMDADPAGVALAQTVRQTIESLRRGDVTFRSHQPTGFKDWNEQLKTASIHRYRSGLSVGRRL